MATRSAPEAGGGAGPFGDKRRTGFGFESKRAERLFECMVDAFVNDHMRKKLSSDSSGWRDLAQLARMMNVPPSSVYGRHGGVGPEFGELARSGMVETSVVTGQRGRGGAVTRYRIAYEREPIRDYVNERVKGAPRAEAVKVLLPTNHVAILPFVNMSPEQADEYLADGLTEELISTTSKVSGLRVVSRTSVMQYKQSTKSAGQIGRELNAGTLLEGSVRKAGGRIRVNVQMIDANRDLHLWAESYDRSLRSLFAIQSEIAEKVAGELKVQLLPSEKEATELRDTDNIEAYTWYIRATQLLHQGTEESLREAVELFEQIMSVDNQFARAYAGLAEALDALTSQNFEDFATAVGRAEAAACKALEIGPNRPEAHAAMAWVFLASDRIQEAISEAKKAVSLNTNFARAYEMLGSAYSSLGDLELGIESLEKASALNPLSFQIGHLLCHVYLAAGRRRDALREVERLNQLHPSNPLSFHCLAQYHIGSRDLENAQRAVDAGMKVDPQAPVLIIDQGIVYALAQKRQAAEEQLRIVERNDKESVRLFGQVWICAALGDFGKAFEALMKQAETHSWYTLMKTEPLFEGLRKDPRFAEFCAKVGLPP